MIEKITQIKNPLTIIAIFAGISEISGTVVLPFLSEQNQSIFVWFLMGFPALLVLLFFVVLLVNRKVLYAPSDFQSEENFINLIRSKVDNVEKEVVESIQREVLLKIDELSLKSHEHYSMLKTSLAEQYVLKGKKNLDEGMLEEALFDFKVAVNEKPKARTYGLIAYTLKRLERPGEAISYINTGICIVGKDTKTYASLLYNRACYNCLSGGTIDEILSDLDASFELDHTVRRDIENELVGDLLRIREDHRVVDLIAKWDNYLKENKIAIIAEQGAAH